MLCFLPGIDIEEADFVYLREKTESTAGNLSVQIDKLARAEYITVEKGFAGRKPRTVCRVTDKGRRAFEDYVIRQLKLKKKLLML